MAASATRSPAGGCQRLRNLRTPSRERTMTMSLSKMSLSGYQVAACEAIQRGFTQHQRQGGERAPESGLRAGERVVYADAVDLGQIACKNVGQVRINHDCLVTPPSRWRMRHRF